MPYQCTGEITQATQTNGEITLTVRMNGPAGTIPMGHVVIIPANSWRKWMSADLIQQYVDKIIKGEIKQ